jgi:opacity protein-like surface antigen
MMKKLAMLVLCLTLVQWLYAAGPLDTKTFSLAIGAGARNFTEAQFKDSYDSTPITYNVDLAYKFWKTMEVFFHTDMLSADGKLTYTNEDTTLKITPLELGVRYLLAMEKSKHQKIYPYLGGGVGYYMVKEDNFIGNLDEKKIGFFVEGGLRFYVTGSIFVDAKLKYVSISIESQTQVSNVGGLAYTGAIGFSF